MKAFAGNPFPTVGVEQEFHLIDAKTGELTPAIDTVLEVLDEDLRKAVDYELFQAVLEWKSPVYKTVDELLTGIMQSRLRLAAACDKVGVKLVAAGSHPFSAWQGLAAIENEHYRWVLEHCVYLSRRLLSFGLHVHVGMESVETAMYAMNEMRRWVYPLMALSANSPYYEGHLTGLASTRGHLFGSMPRTKMIPHFHNFAELEAFYEKLLATDDVARPGDLWWIIRPQPPLGTVEVRAFDLPTNTFRLASFAALVQAALATYQDQCKKGITPSVLQEQYLDQNHWKAMRYGLNSDIIEPETGEVLSMRAYLVRLLDLIQPKARELHSIKYIDFVRDMIERGDNESHWQIETCRQLNNDVKKLEFEIADKTIEMQKSV